jgi:histidyl-tRNA synthetase
MAEIIKKPRGTNDFIGEEEILFDIIKDKLFQISETFGANKVDVPVFEETKLFVRSVGESSDIVNKEMFRLDVKGEHDYVLRPEFTAGINRMMIENKLFASPDLPLKFSYLGPVFRFERPQAGRLRQFHQFGVEFLDAKIDFLTMMDAVLNIYHAGKAILGHDLMLKINFLGSKESRENYKTALKDYYQDKLDCMCEDCKRRYQVNILRILDCKVESDIEINKNAPILTDYLIQEDQDMFNKIKQGLEKLGIEYVIDPKLVRGLDYYTGLVFELYDPSNLQLGAIGAGGQYGNLTSELGGPSFEGIGFSFGVERLLLALDQTQKDKLLDGKKPYLDYFVIDLRKEKDLLPLQVENTLRENGKKVSSSSYSKALNGSLKMADRKNSKYVLIFDDYNQNKVIVKNMKERTQDIVDYKDILTFLSK